MTDLSATEILAIPLNQPERLFPGEEGAAKTEFRRLAKAWHPDVNAVGPEVFAHLQVLYDLALERIAAGTWREAGMLRLTSADGRRYELKFTAARPFELGEAFVGVRTMSYLVEREYRDLAEAGVRAIEGFRFPDSAMRAEHERYLPKLKAFVRTADGKALVVLEKHPDQVRLRDAVDHLKGRVDPKHAAWIVSSLLNLNCYLKFAGLSHGAIGPDEYFIDPGQHSGALLGGWWYCARVGQRMRALPARTVDSVPLAFLAGGAARPEVDAELIRLTLRELLGDRFGARLATMKDVPGALAAWARGLGGPDAFAEYHDWSTKTLTESFGPRRFVRMDLKATDVYRKD